ncbi:hypothetical protein [Methylobacterium sp. WSM2598]|uniref:hypothetical protein n=1 Tax=Methylobacterium sp. WSM2598 TaxID=398261 RepID=UPI000363CF62|nr:hypothetical protein [Methylobacterium sp. WSM2598]
MDLGPRGAHIAAQRDCLAQMLVQLQRHLERLEGDSSVQLLSLEDMLAKAAAVSCALARMLSLVVTLDA